MPEMVRTLMQLGADLHVTTAGIYALRYAATPLANATERGNEEIAAILQEGERQREDDGRGTPMHPLDCAAPSKPATRTSSSIF